MALGRKGLDQTTSWVLAFFLAGLAFTGLYFLTRYVAKGVDAAFQGGEEIRPDDVMEGGEAGEGESSSEVESSSTKESAEHHPSWGYQGSLGPEHWGDLDDRFEICASGRQQSPIDLDAATSSDKLLPLTIRYREARVAGHHNGHTVEWKYESGSYLEIDGERFDLTAFHVHVPSEHRVQGIAYDLEMHLLHQNEAGKLAVLALLFEEGRENRALASLWQRLPAARGERGGEVDFDLTSLLPAKRTYYHYMGSLTTPPCTEGVRWYVMTSPLQMSAPQIDTIVKLLRVNARPIQARGARRLLRSSR